MKGLLLVVIVTLGSVGCVRTLKITPAHQKTRILKPGECYTYSAPMYWIDGTVSQWTYTACLPKVSR